MHIISKKKIERFSKKYRNSRVPLLEWYKITKNVDIQNHAELQSLFPSADLVGRKTVFNIGGNKFRLIVRVNFLYKKVFILHILTHAEYDRGKWKE